MVWLPIAKAIDWLYSVAHHFDMNNFSGKDRPCVYSFSSSARNFVPLKAGLRTFFTKFQWLGKCFMLSHTIKNGFSLLEVLISLAIFLIIASVMFAFLTSGRKTFDMGAAQIDVEQEARRGLDYMSKELRQSSDGKISGVAKGASGNTIIFEIPYNVDNSVDGDVIDSFGAIEWSDDTGVNRIGTITYSLVGGQILRNLSFTGEQIVLANDISSLNFSRPLAADTVAINLTAEKYPFKGFSGPTDEKVTVSLNTQVRVRN
ncbi:MAG: prepilin-type N-terminal cleavage/methylation domain-containing protein [Candidatus Omnitrophota bacterium]|nr:prepilin-type N-terminal cleavage/methylation domain-containing protein [Candidatus Omnitrophota bacterium]